MPGKPWTTDEQAKFLAAYISRYLQAQADHSLSPQFWPLIYREWFRQYSEKEFQFPGCTNLTAEQEVSLKARLDERRKMIRTWFRWRGNNGVRKKGGNIVLAPSLPKTRQLQDTEVYSKLYYESKLKAVIDAEITGMSLSGSDKLAKIVDVTKREWTNESDDVKAHVHAMKEELREQSPKPGDPASPEQRQAAIDNLSYVTSAFLDHVRQTTNWTGFMVLGGPKPDVGGEIAIASFFNGGDVDQRTFKAFYPTFEGNVVLPFGEFLKVLYVNPSSSEPVTTPLPGSIISHSESAEPSTQSIMPAHVADVSTEMVPLLPAPGDAAGIERSDDQLIMRAPEMPFDPDIIDFGTPFDFGDPTSYALPFAYPHYTSSFDRDHASHIASGIQDATVTCINNDGNASFTSAGSGVYCNPLPNTNSLIGALIGGDASPLSAGVDHTTLFDAAFVDDSANASLVASAAALSASMLMPRDAIEPMGQLLAPTPSSAVLLRTDIGNTLRRSGRPIIPTAKVAQSDKPKSKAGKENGSGQKHSNKRGSRGGAGSRPAKRQHTEAT